MSAPNPIPPAGFKYGVVSPESARVHLVAPDCAVSICGVEVIMTPPSDYAMRWGKACPKCNNLRLRGVTS